MPLFSQEDLINWVLLVLRRNEQ